MILGTEQTSELKARLESLGTVPAYVAKTRETDMEYWSSRSIGEPTLCDYDFALGPGRVRFVELWQKAGGLYGVGRSTVELQYIYPGSSLLSVVEADDTAMDITFTDLYKKHVILDGGFNNSEADQIPDRSYSIRAKLEFLADGTCTGQFMRRIEDDPYPIGLDEGIELETYQKFGQAAAFYEMEYANEPISEDTANDLAERIAEFVLVEKANVARRQESGRSVYYS